MSPTCLIIIVTYNSQKHIKWAIDGLNNSESSLVIKIIDSGSTDTKYLECLQSKHPLSIEKHENIGFVAGNNKAIEQEHGCDWVLLLNPDARIEGRALDDLLAIAVREDNADVGIFSVPLIRYDIKENKPLELYDSLGINCSKLGKWQDVGSNQPIKSININDIEKMPEAICGAFMLIRNDALLQCKDKKGLIGFERSYYMYKEDIELSQRFKANGWKLRIAENLSAYHCRGWNSTRSDTPYWARYHSAVNDLDLAIRYKNRAFPYALLKYIWVRFFEKR